MQLTQLTAVLFRVIGRLLLSVKLRCTFIDRQFNVTYEVLYQDPIACCVWITLLSGYFKRVVSTQYLQVPKVELLK